MNAARIFATIFLILGLLTLPGQKSGWAVEESDEFGNTLFPMEETGASPDHESSVPPSPAAAKAPDDTSVTEDASATSSGSTSPDNAHESEPVVSKLPAVRINLFAAERDFDLNGVLVNGAAIADRISQTLGARLAQSGKFRVLKSSTAATNDAPAKTQQTDLLPMESVSTDDSVSRDTSMDGVTENEFTLSPPEKEIKTVPSDGVPKPLRQQAAAPESKIEKSLPHNVYVLQGTVASVSPNEKPQTSALTGGVLKPAKAKLVLNCEVQTADTGMTIWNFTMARAVDTDSEEESAQLSRILDSIGSEIALSMIESLNPARVVEANSGTVRLDAGSGLYAKGERLTVYEEQDGATEDSQELMPMLFGTPVGTITITGADKGKAIASYSGPVSPAPGMICRRPGKSPSSGQTQDRNGGNVTILEGGGVKLPFDK